ncbi:hypothetical protein NC653_026476 [Populus alba x Populus x berolinensis]|uniref:Uncharacterized protein n=1 Tax=Populus alba x Populus x berolinensis TaxID=444605 RepID=A0AAD6MDV7_9ROSI|nr:hypothetical protein NC653_026476 [Populus alba x Populus x berolinensis]
MKRMDHIIELLMFNVYWKADPGLQHNHCFMFPEVNPTKDTSSIFSVAGVLLSRFLILFEFSLSLQCSLKSS